MAKSQISNLKVAISSLLFGAYGHHKIGIFLWALLTCVPSLKKNTDSFLSYRIHKETSMAMGGGPESNISTTFVWGYSDLPNDVYSASTLACFRKKAKILSL